jgi:nucleoside-diphosphate-sugar epimerase
MMRVLVSGAGGFIGLPLVTELAHRGAEVHALSRRPDPPEVQGVRWHRVDLADEDPLEKLLRELSPERLVHLAWCTEHGRFWRAPENVVWVERSLRLLRAFARHGGRRLVMLGTCAEYDWSTVDGPLGESRSRLAPATLYGAAKDALRRVAGSYAEQEGIELAWGRPFFLYGPREAPARMVPSVIRSLLTDGAVATAGGEQVRDYMHVEDLAGAAVALLDGPLVGEVNLASGVGVTVDSVVSRIARLTGRPEPIRGAGPTGRSLGPPSLVADIARLQVEVGFRPRWTLTDGLAATVRWWEAHEQAR